MDDLVKFRAQGIIALAAVTWLCVAVIAANALFSKAGMLPVLLALAAAIMPTAMAHGRRTDGAARLVFGIPLPLYPAILLYQWAGGAWQIDIHMLFFAVIACLAVLADWRVILAAAAVTAVHHLLVNLAMPALVFPDGASLARVLMHAVIVVLEAVVLIWMASRLELLVTGMAQARAEREALEAATQTEREARLAEQQAVIEQVSHALQALASGDLQYRLTTALPQDYERLQRDFNDAGEQLEQAMRSVSDAALGIIAGSRQLQDAAQELAARARQQTMTLEKASGNMGEVTDLIADTARSASEVHGSVQQARQTADAGGQVVGRAVEAMREIRDGTASISRIVGVLEEIAYQTNLLALNASIEAARAGQAGASFTVVAAEVRSLAQRSGEEANKIKDLIKQTIARFDGGVKLVDESGQAFERISASVDGISLISESIADAANRQADQLRRVGASVDELDRVTHQHAGMVDESTAVARRFAEEAQRLSALVARFRLGQGGSTDEFNRAA